MLKVLPNILMAGAGVGALVDIFYMAGWQRAVLIASLAAFGIGYFWDKFYPSK